jgi:SAM-dependent methyltransferase
MLRKKELFNIQKNIYSSDFNWKYCADSWHGKSRLRKAFRILLKKKVTRILDIGCGNGFFLRGLPDKIEKIGMDITGFSNLDFRYVVGDANNGLPFKKDSFDAIFAGEIIEHLFSPQFFLNECWSILSANGRIVLTTPNLCSLKNLFYLLSGRQLFGVDSDSQHSSGHIRTFSPISLRNSLEKSRFRIEILTTDRIPIPFAPVKPSFTRLEELLAEVFKRWGDCLIMEGKKIDK